MKKVLVRWVDSNVTHGWQMEGEIPCELAVCESLGFVKAEDDNKIVLSQTQSNFGSHMGVLAIPKGCIKGIEELRVRGKSPTTPAAIKAVNNAISENL